MWQCPKCEKFQTTPEANFKHLQTCKEKIKLQVVGWQGDFTPKNKFGEYVWK